MSLLDYVMEARKKSPTINVKTDNPGANTDDDFSNGVPEDPDVTPEDNDGEAEEAPENDNNDVGTGTDYGQGMPTDDNENQGGNDAGDDDYAANVPTDDTPADNPPDQGGGDTGGGGISVSDPNVGNDQAAPADQGNTGGGDDFGAGMPTDDQTPDPNASPAPADNPDGTAVSVGGDTGNPPPADPNQNAGGGDDFGAGLPTDDTGGNDPNATPAGGDQTVGQDPNDAGGNPPDQGGDPNAAGDGDPNDPNANPEGGDGMAGGLDDMSNANSFSDAAGNGENSEQMTDTDKKNNVIILRHAYVNLYNEIAGFLRKLEDARKDSVLAIVTFNQVKENLIQLKEYIVNYVSIYYDTNEYEINLFNFEYFIQIMRVNCRMIEVMKEGKRKLNFLTEEDKKKKKMDKFKMQK